MALPKSFTKVTTFSKTLAMILFISLPILSFYLGMIYQNMITPAYPPTHYEPIQTAGSSPTQNNSETGCAADAKECPDGSWVGRTGLQCEFVCPSQ